MRNFSCQGVDTIIYFLYLLFFTKIRIFLKTREGNIFFKWINFLKSTSFSSLLKNILNKSSFDLVGTPYPLGLWSILLDNIVKRYKRISLVYMWGRYKWWSDYYKWLDIVVEEDDDNFSITRFIGSYSSAIYLLLDI